MFVHHKAEKDNWNLDISLQDFGYSWSLEIKEKTISLARYQDF